MSVPDHEGRPSGKGSGPRTPSVSPSDSADETTDQHQYRRLSDTPGKQRGEGSPPPTPPANQQQRDENRNERPYLVPCPLGNARRRAGGEHEPEGNAQSRQRPGEITNQQATQDDNDECHGPRDPGDQPEPEDHRGTDLHHPCWCVVNVGQRLRCRWVVALAPMHEAQRFLVHLLIGVDVINGRYESKPGREPQHCEERDPCCEAAPLCRSRRNPAADVRLHASDRLALHGPLPTQGRPHSIRSPVAPEGADACVSSKPFYLSGEGRGLGISAPIHPWSGSPSC